MPFAATDLVAIGADLGERASVFQRRESEHRPAGAVEMGRRSPPNCLRVRIGSKGSI